MARPLRIERPGGRYHVTARGNERKAIYRDDSDRTHFLELLAESTERFALRIHAYVLMENHFHLLEVLEIDEKTGNVTLNNAGVVMRLNIDKMVPCPPAINCPSCHRRPPPFPTALVRSAGRYPLRNGRQSPLKATCKSGDSLAWFVGAWLRDVAAGVSPALEGGILPPGAATERSAAEDARLYGRQDFRRGHPPLRIQGSIKTRA